jgi:2'-5' RNA ligase
VTAVRERALRLFVAIELSPAWLEALAEAQRRLRRLVEGAGGPRLRYVRPEGIHLTLKFLGSVPESRLAAVTVALDAATSDWAPISLVMGRPGAFPQSGSPRVLWAGVEGASAADRERLQRLAERVEARLAAAGFPREDRFQPHLTLARVPDDTGRDQRAFIAAAVARLAAPRPAPLRVDHISLMQSHLGPGGARYERLAAFPREGREGATGSP